MTQLLRHARVELALHPLRRGDGPALLLLHALGERSPERVPGEAVAWPGPIYALDFTGHGDSTVPVGGGYTAELLMADADIALAQLGKVSLLGRGVGAYAALLLAGSRPSHVRGAVLCDGPGLAGGSPEPIYGEPPPRATATGQAPDPFALAELARDVRPPDYAAVFATLALERSGLDPALAVCAEERPPWLAGMVDRPGVMVCPVEEALQAIGSARAGERRR
jgi:pimeloyl-ACP methyl ester carboxylesterase